MQLHTLILFGFVLALACLMNTTSAQSCNQQDIELVQRKLCRPFLFTFSFLHWTNPCRQLVQTIFRDYSCSCNGGKDDGSSSSSSSTSSTSSTTTTTNAP